MFAYIAVHLLIAAGAYLYEFLGGLGLFYFFIFFSSSFFFFFTLVFILNVFK